MAFGIAILTPLLVLASLVVWVLPVDLVQHWLGINEFAQDYAEYEASGRVEFFWWLLRWLGPVSVIVLILLKRRLRSVLADLQDAIAMAMQMTAFSIENTRQAMAVSSPAAPVAKKDSRTKPPGPSGVWKTVALRGLVLAWIGLLLKNGY